MSLRETPELKAYCKRYGLAPFNSKTPWCAHLAAGIRCKNDEDCLPPERDHTQVFKRADGKLVFTSQPYIGRAIQGADLEQFKLKLEAWAAPFGLSVRISEEDSWHFPGHTILYEIWKGSGNE
jgi:hypothetical protein